MKHREKAFFSAITHTITINSEFHRNTQLIAKILSLQGLLLALEYPNIVFLDVKAWP